MSRTQQRVQFGPAELGRIPSQKGQAFRVVFTALPSQYSWYALSFSICYILAVEQIFFDYKNEIMHFFFFLHLRWERPLLGTVFCLI